MNSVQSEIRDGIRTVDFNSPPLNILTINLMREIREEIENDQEASVLLLKGSGRIFSAGVAIEEHTPEHVADMIAAITDLMFSVMEYPGVTASAIHGGAYGGGCELALCTDLVVAEETAVFSLPEITLGVFPPAAIALFPELYPDSWVKELVFSGKEYEATELEELAIVNETVPEGECVPGATSYLNSFTGFSKPVVRLAKKSFQVDMEKLRDRFDRVNDIYLQSLMEVEDVEEGLNAFLEDRAPDWSHR